MSRFAHLADRPQKSASEPTPPSRVGRKAISGYFAPELSLQSLMAEAFNDVWRKPCRGVRGGRVRTISHRHAKALYQ
ncbi:MAG: hypothetical protein KDE63_03240 [Novosphingobium sp.]|nr:hypothetical protein [Novosphingobium sp.]